MTNPQSAIRNPQFLRGFLFGALAVAAWWAGTGIGERLFGGASPAREASGDAIRGAVGGSAAGGRPSAASAASAPPLRLPLPPGAVVKHAVPGGPGGGRGTWLVEAPQGADDVAAFLRSALSREGYAEDAAWGEEVGRRTGERMLAFRKGGFLVLAHLDPMPLKGTAITIEEGRPRPGR